MKNCRTCGELKPLSDYYTHSQMADGHLNICKPCTKKRVSNHRQENLERIQEYDRKRGQLPERKEKCSNRIKEVAKDPERLKRDNERKKEWYYRNREKKRANVIVFRAIQSGELKPQSCERCGENELEKVQAHHEDYSKPLLVNWLCTACHGERHREINEERRNAHRRQAT